MERLVISQEHKESWYVRDISRSFHTQYGPIPTEELQKKTPHTYTTHKEETFTIIEPSFHDKMTNLKRQAQVILPKDAAIILAYTGADKTKTVVDSGAGSGWLSCFLSHYVKKVYACDINESHLKTVEKNIQIIQADNITLKHHDIYEGLPEKPDILTLDVPEPWRVFAHAQKTMDPGSYIVCYSPSITQSQETVNQAQEQGLLVLETIDIQIRQWHIKGRAVRPKKDEVGPTGFLTFMRVIT